jgi:ABC-type phosphate transport system auxiliary subunit
MQTTIEASEARRRAREEMLCIARLVARASRMDWRQLAQLNDQFEKAQREERSATAALRAAVRES